MWREKILIALAAMSPLVGATAASFEIITPSADRWMYPFNASPGSRTAGSVFGAIGEADFDDRDAQFLVRFDTSSIVAPGQGAANYAITSLRLSLTVNAGNSFLYDPTQDSLGTYSGGADSDAGRPVEIFGVGYRNGFNSSTFAENSAFAPPGSSGEGIRNAYAAGFDGGGGTVDVSNNVGQGFEVTPFATGQIAGLSPGDFVPEDAIMTFDINVSSAEMLAYFQASLNAGYVEVMVTSLHPTSQMAGSGFPSFYTKESPFHIPGESDPFFHVAPQLSGNISVVPEPSVFALLGLATLAGWGMLARRND